MSTYLIQVSDDATSRQRLVKKLPGVKVYANKGKVKKSYPIDSKYEEPKNGVGILLMDWDDVKEPEKLRNIETLYITNSEYTSYTIEQIKMVREGDVKFGVMGGSGLATSHLKYITYREFIKMLSDENILTVIDNNDVRHLLTGMEDVAGGWAESRVFADLTKDGVAEKLSTVPENHNRKTILSYCSQKTTMNLVNVLSKVMNCDSYVCLSV